MYLSYSHLHIYIYIHYHIAKWKSTKTVLGGKMPEFLDFEMREQLLC